MTCVNQTFIDLAALGAPSCQSAGAAAAGKADTWGIVPSRSGCRATMRRRHIARLSRTSAHRLFRSGNGARARECRGAYAYGGVSNPRASRTFSRYPKSPSIASCADICCLTHKREPENCSAKHSVERVTLCRLALQESNTTFVSHSKQIHFEACNGCSDKSCGDARLYRLSWRFGTPMRRSRYPIEVSNAGAESIPKSVKGVLVAPFLSATKDRSERRLHSPMSRCCLRP